MKKQMFKEHQIVRILREAEQGKMPQKGIYKKSAVSEPTIYRWKAKFGGMDFPDAKRLKTIESENAE